MKRLLEVALPPGFYDGTARQVKSKWVRGNHVRFREGRLRPIGGWQEFPLSRHSENLDSAVRGHHQWRRDDNVGLLAIGTAGSGAPNYGKLYAAEMVSATTFTDPTADTVSGSTTMTVDDTTNLEVGDIIAGTGIPANATIASITNSTTFEISAAATATGTNILITITPVLARQRFYDITPSGYQATGDTGFRPGFGYYFFGEGIYGYVYTGPGSASFSRVAHWHLDNFGADLVGLQSGDKSIFFFDSADLTIPAKEITVSNGFTESAPTAIGVLVTQERHVLALGADGDARNIRWSSKETVDVWTPSATNSAGDLPLQTQGYIVTARRVPQGVVIWTDVDCHILNYLGSPLVYGVSKLAENAGVYSPYAVHSSSEITTWLNRGGFWVYDGYAKPIQDCPIQDRVLRTIDWSQEGLIYSGSNAEFGEVWWWCPSISGDEGKCSYYVVYNYREGVWSDSFSSSNISRNCWIDKGVWNTPIAVDPTDNKIYQHETTDPDQSSIIGEAETGAIDINSGERYTRISKIFTDTDQQDAGDVNYQFFTAISGDATETESQVYPLEEDGEIDVRLQGRQVRYKVSGSVVNDWTVGNTRFEIHPGGRR